VAEPVKNRKPNIRELLEELADDETFTEAEKRLEREKLLEKEYQEWSSRIKNGGANGA
jgi:hypothetical protein